MFASTDEPWTMCDTGPHAHATSGTATRATRTTIATRAVNGPDHGTLCEAVPGVTVNL